MGESKEFITLIILLKTIIKQTNNFPFVKHIKAKISKIRKSEFILIKNGYLKEMCMNYKGLSHLIKQ